MRNLRREIRRIIREELSLNESITSDWDKTESKLQPHLKALRKHAANVGGWYSIEDPYLDTAKGKVYFRISEPEEIDIANDYDEEEEGGYYEWDPASLAAYRKYSDALWEIRQILKNFCKKHDLRLLIAADWRD